MKARLAREEGDAARAAAAAALSAAPSGGAGASGSGSGGAAAAGFSWAAPATSQNDWFFPAAATSCAGLRDDDSRDDEDVDLARESLQAIVNTMGRHAGSQLAQPGRAPSIAAEGGAAAWRRASWGGESGGGGGMSRSSGGASI